MASDTLIDHRKKMWQVLFEFKKLLEDEESLSEFQPILDAFSKYDDKVKTVIEQPHTITRINQDEIINIYDNDTPSVQAIEVNLQTQSGTWIELENGDFVDMSKIDYLAAEKRLILFSNGKWTKPNMLSTKDLARIKYAIRFNLFK
jgi:hypothetical protein